MATGTRPRSFTSGTRPRSWTSTTQSLFQGAIPYTPEYLEVVGISPCKCPEDCNCHWDPEQKEISCECVAGNEECGAGCQACNKACMNGVSDNRQVSQNQLIIRQTQYEYLNAQMGYSLKIHPDEDIKAGDAIIGFAGNVLLSDQVPTNHTTYVVSLGRWKFRLKKDYGGVKAGTLYEGEWVMDCTDYGTDANFINSTCNNNNTQAYVVIVRRLPIPMVYAKNNISGGLLLICIDFVSVLVQCLL